MNIPEQLKEARKGLTQQQAAEIIGCPLRTLQEWEQGRQAPPRWALKYILLVLRQESQPRPTFNGLGKTKTKKEDNEKQHQQDKST